MEREIGGRDGRRKGTPRTVIVLSQPLGVPERTVNTLGPSTWNFCVEGTVESNGPWQKEAAPEALS